MLTFLLVGFGYNLVQDFRVYPWTAGQSFTQIVQVLLAFFLASQSVPSPLKKYKEKAFIATIQYFRVILWMNPFLCLWLFASESYTSLEVQGPVDLCMYTSVHIIQMNFLTIWIIFIQKPHHCHLFAFALFVKGMIGDLNGVYLVSVITNATGVNHTDSNWLSLSWERGEIV